MKINKISLGLFCFILCFVFGISFTSAGGVYNIYSVGYTYGCNGNDNTSDYCTAGYSILGADKGGTSQSGSYRCAKPDNTTPTISVSGINPLKQWVNIEKYNPIKNIKIEIKDSGAGIRLIKVTIGTKTAIWDFGFQKYRNSNYLSYTIDYSKFCSKVGGGDCYKTALLEGKNVIKVEAYDAIYSSRNGSEAPGSSNKAYYSNEIWVDNSRSNFDFAGSNNLYALSLANGPYKNMNIDGKWKNITLNLTLNLGDLYGEQVLEQKTKNCTGRPDNSIWVLPNGVDKDTGKFISYNNNPSLSDCKWECKSGYVKYNNKCYKKESDGDCKKYFEDKGYNLSNIDGENIYFVLDGGVVDKKTGKYTKVFDIGVGDYVPNNKNCGIKGGTSTVYYDAKDENGNNIKISQTANNIILSSSALSYFPDRGQKSCGSLGNLIDFNNGGAQNNNGNGDIKANFIYKLKDNYGGGYYDGLDHNKNQLFGDDKEYELWYEIADVNNVVTASKDIEKVCGKKECVANSESLDESNCKCISGYYPIDKTKNTIGRYTQCIKVSDDKCLSDSNSDGYYDSLETLGDKQIVKLTSNTYSTSKIPVCGLVCDIEPKDLDNDGRPESCPIDGECGTSKDTCVKGEYKDIEDTTEYYKWKCLGSGGGKDVTCSKKKNLAKTRAYIAKTSTSEELYCGDYSDNKKKTISGWYKDYIGRCPEPSGLNWWYNDWTDNNRTEEEEYKAFKEAAKKDCKDNYGTENFSECNNKALCKEGDGYIKNTKWCIVDAKKDGIETLYCGDYSDSKKKTISGWYKDYIGRCPEPSGLNWWYNDWTNNNRTEEEEYKAFKEAAKKDCKEAAGTEDFVECNNKLLCKNNDIYIKDTELCK